MNTTKLLLTLATIMFVAAPAVLPTASAVEDTSVTENVTSMKNNIVNTLANRPF